MAEKRRRLQLFRNQENCNNATDAKQAITGQTLLDGEVIIARYKEEGKELQGVLAIKGIGDDYVYFDSAALSSALQSVSGGIGISATEKDNNNQRISLNISGETQEGKIVINDKTSGKNVVEIPGLTAANVTYDKTDNKVITAATTTSAAIKELDAALDAANKANLSGATVTEGNAGATVTLEDSGKHSLASFTVESSDNNLGVAKATGEGITLDIKSVGANASNGTGTVSGDTTATDPLTQKSYVDNEIAKAKKTAAVVMGDGKSIIAGTDIIEFKKNGDETDAEKYYVNMTVGEGDGAKVYNIELDAKNFVKDSFLAGAKTVWGPSAPAPTNPDETSPNKNSDHDAAYIELTMKTITDPDPAATGGTYTFSYIYVKTSDILGDLVGGDGIAIDGSNIAIDLASQTGNSLVKLYLDETAGGKKLNVNVTTGETAFNEDAEDAKKKWSVAEGKGGLTTATEVVNVANNLQDQIDILSSQTITGSNAISVDDSQDDNTTTVSLILDGVTSGQVVTNASNALCVTEHGLYLSNVWDCGTF